MIIRDAEGGQHELEGGTYLGDGVYCWHDGYQFWLGAERSRGWHVIALDLSTANALVHHLQDWRPPEPGDAG